MPRTIRRLHRSTVPLTVNGVHLTLSTMSRDGSGRPLVFLHGFGSTKEDYADVVHQAALDDRPVIAYDAPGCGASRCSDLSALDVPFLVYVAETLLRRSGVDAEFDLVGHSLGGLTGLLLADRNPDRVAAFVDIEGNPVLLMHGDTLCTDDAPYQKFRRDTHTPDWQRAFLARPISERHEFAAQARAESQRYTRSAGEAITDVNAEAVAATLRRHTGGRLIHGHTHRPAHHKMTLDGRQAQRIVLGDWYEQGSALRVDGANIELTTL